ncbi:MAG: hypothetical protein Q9N62_11640 [Ghiorsea sp.]|nr:hypothetical protein [Ghiorsea sp.]
MATWLHNKTLSPEATMLLKAGKEVYKLYFSLLHELPTAPFKIQTWDAGWTQIRKSLADRNKASEELEQVKQARNILAAKIEPHIYQYGFLDEDEIYI